VTKALRVLSIIPARAGSKGLPGKNWSMLGNSPLILWTLKASLSCPKINKTIVSTDSPDVIRVVSDFGFSVENLRPQALAQDTTPILAVVEHELSKLLESGEVFDVVLLLEPTSPLRKIDDLEKVLSYLESSPEADAVVSFSSAEQIPTFMFKKTEEGYIEPLLIGQEMGRRQDQGHFLYPNGVAYAVKVEALLKERTFYPNKTLPYHVDTKQSFEIDDNVDREIVELFSKSKEYKWLF